MSVTIRTNASNRVKALRFGPPPPAPTRVIRRAVGTSVPFLARPASEKSNRQRTLWAILWPVRHMAQHNYSICHSDSRVRSVRARQPTQYSHKVSLSQCGSRARAKHMRLRDLLLSPWARTGHANHLSACTRWCCMPLSIAEPLAMRRARGEDSAIHFVVVAQTSTTP